ncbi:hypothetical protein NDU88_003961 [Pleurodeles waltl]|uniref:Uncharacterized protein n=1 Tax=Pleurodeles waltl TaxID=8319 RepID=A0AAV7WT61_PLEWA|nr:hypothetical protein NDU88_003961 [Pleurodeles waltl]
MVPLIGNCPPDPAAPAPASLLLVAGPPFAQTVAAAILFWRPRSPAALLTAASPDFRVPIGGIKRAGPRLPPQSSSLSVRLHQPLATPPRRQVYEFEGVIWAFILTVKATPCCMMLIRLLLSVTRVFHCDTASVYGVDIAVY